MHETSSILALFSSFNESLDESVSNETQSSGSREFSHVLYVLYDSMSYLIIQYIGRILINAAFYIVTPFL